MSDDVSGERNQQLAAECAGLVAAALHIECDTAMTSQITEIIAAALACSYADGRVFAAIARERAWQDQKWGTIAEHPHEVGGWLTLVRKELREAEDAWCSQRGDASALEELLQVAAVAIACIQQHGIVERPEMRGAK